VSDFTPSGQALAIELEDKFRMTNVCMVEPAEFGYNAETAATNRFQQPIAVADAAGRARSEFNNLAQALRTAGVRVAIVQDTASPPKPDAVFPNNWVSFHADGTVVLYPLLNPSRRAERRESVIDAIKQELGFTETRRLDLTAEERRGRFLEGTGSLVIDHAAHVVYACRSPRTHEALVHEWARQLGYEVFLFDANTTDGTPVYHTNVLLWIGSKAAAVGLAWIAPAQRTALVNRLTQSKRPLLTLTGQQLMQFAGNMLEIQLESGGAVLAMSAQAQQSLDANQSTQLHDQDLRLVVAAVPTIETLGGGSVRCMLAEVPETQAIL
jgi:hypothetical protein